MGSQGLNPDDIINPNRLQVDTALDKISEMNAEAETPEHKESVQEQIEKKKIIKFDKTKIKLKTDISGENKIKLKLQSKIDEKMKES